MLEVIKTVEELVNTNGSIAQLNGEIVIITSVHPITEKEYNVYYAKPEALWLKQFTTLHPTFMLVTYTL